MANELLLVGSIPCRTTEETFQHVGPKIGEFIAYLPDGEVGERTYWVTFLCHRVYAIHPDIETVRRPAPIDGIEQLYGTDLTNTWRFELKPGVKEIKFGDPGWRLRYAREAVNSYAVFKYLKRDGVIPAHVRFQVCLPAPYSATFFFPKPEDVEIVNDAFTEALGLEIDTMLDFIPAEELAIQWDCARENAGIERAIAEHGGINADVERVGDGFFKHLESLHRHIPDGVPVGVHSCYGTAEGWPTRQPKDVGGNVVLLNAATRAVGRPFDFVHFPTLGDLGEEQFAPLADLEVGNARVYAGMIHHLNDRDTLKKQMEQVAKYVPDFGVAAPCGFGRAPEEMTTKSGATAHDAARDYVDTVLDDHVEAAKVLHEVVG